MWQDKLKTRYLGEEVEAVRVIESPATPDAVTIIFPDGSKLQLEVRGNFPHGLGELEAADIAWGQSAGEWYGNIIKKLYENATEKDLDLDL
jgi:hypothetical protein